MYEHKRHHLLPWPRFIKRASRHLLIGIVIAAVADFIGTLGYHVAGELGWLDSFLNASMILSGMGLVLAPWAHRMLHVVTRKNADSRRAGFAV